MKALMRPRWLLSLLFLSVLQTASAFYDPAPQRWINRDPINELGFNILNGKRRVFNMDEEKKLYGFVRNNSVSLADKDGRGLFILLLGCPCKAVKYWRSDGSPIFIWDILKIAREAEPKGNGDIRHCVAACLLNRHFPLQAELGAKELWDLFNEDSRNEDSAADMAAEKAGEGLACSADKSCVSACRERFPNPRP